MRGACGIRVRIVLTICGLAMLAMVTWVIKPDGQPKDEVFVPDAWTTTTTESVLVVTRIKIDPRPRSDLRYGARKPGKIQILRRVRRDMTENWDRVNPPRVVHGRNRNGRLVNQRPASQPQKKNKITLVDVRPPVNRSVDETADSVSYLPESSPLPTADPASYLPESYPSSTTAAPSTVNADYILGFSTRDTDHWKHGCWVEKTVNVTRGVPSTWFDGTRKFVECASPQELAVLGTLVLLVLVGLVGSVGYQVCHRVEMKRRRFYQPASRIFQSKNKGRSVRGWTPLLRRQTGGLEDVEEDYFTPPSGRRIEVLRPLVSGREASEASGLDRSVPVYCCSTTSSMVDGYATVRPFGRSSLKARNCDFERLETFTPRVATASRIATASSAEDFPAPPAADELEFASPVHSSDEERSG